MALTRSMLKGMGLTEEQVSAIIDEHTNVTSALKDDIKKYKDDAEKLAEVQKELDELKTGQGDWEKKYNDEHKAFETYKSDIAAKETMNSIKSAYKKLLTDCKVGDKHINSIIGVTDFSEMKLDKDGNLEGLDDLRKVITDKWSGFISSEGTKGADVDNPPGDDGGDDGKKTGRAAELAKRYHDNLYGAVKEN